MENLRSVRMSRSIKEYNQDVTAYSLKLKKLKLPKKLRQFTADGGGLKKYGIKKLYLASSSLKKSSFKKLSKKCTVYVKNKKVRDQVRKAGFKGKIVIEKKFDRCGGYIRIIILEMVGWG